MRLLLDACVPRGLASHFADYFVRTAQDMGWGDLDNGALLDAMAGIFDVLVTVDRGIPTQQYLVGRSIAVVVLRAKSNRLGDLVPLIPESLTVLKSIQQGSVAVIGEVRG